MVDGLRVYSGAHECGHVSYVVSGNSRLICVYTDKSMLN
jgi:hypothetical protein